jgi:hypothetical protein
MATSSRSLARRPLTRSPSRRQTAAARKKPTAAIRPASARPNVGGAALGSKTGTPRASRPSKIEPAAAPVSIQAGRWRARTSRAAEMPATVAARAARRPKSQIRARRDGRTASNSSTTTIAASAEPTTKPAVGRADDRPAACRSATAACAPGPGTGRPAAAASPGTAGGTARPRPTMVRWPRRIEAWATLMARPRQGE